MKKEMVNSRELFLFLFICTILIVPHGCPVGKVQACGHELYTWLVQACLPTLRSWNLTSYRPYDDDFFTIGRGPQLVEMCCENKCDYPVLYGYKKCELLIPEGVDIDL
ncbi:uncharacterized protein LOC111618708 [Centruroides sculpturatus]|uniref:uncharacterized protein LOC111618708 n=1 Tax=Centruroides sculpturatus TaxID=218467 RepID=UPI000C6E2A1F|nr:uncharacterized protein LOC111618708 [Centruroides sculpturatus]XP_023216048.1 uncharacterized protein LOC111618708 [Centruroides sculpturatus]